MKDRSNKNSSENIGRVEFGVEFGNINANKLLEIPRRSSPLKKKNKKKR